jgi:hypothetical protein
MISAAQAKLVTVLYSLHHVLLDRNVTFAQERAFAAVLEQNHVVHEMKTYEYPGLAAETVHAASGRDPRILSPVRVWYILQGALAE